MDSIEPKTTSGYLRLLADQLEQKRDDTPDFLVVIKDTESGRLVTAWQANYDVFGLIGGLHYSLAAITNSIE